MEMSARLAAGIVSIRAPAKGATTTAGVDARASG